MIHILRGIVFCLAVGAMAQAQPGTAQEPAQALRAGSPARAEVITVLNVPASTLATANQMLTAQSERLMECIVGSEPGPWRYRLELRNAGVHSAALVADGTDATPSVTTCVEEVLRSLRFPQLGQSIEVRVSRREIFGVVPGGIGGIGGGGGIGAVRGGSTRSPPNAGIGSRVQRTPRVRPGSLDVRGGLASDIVRRVVRRHLSELRFCYQQVLAQRPRAQGALTLELVVSAVGTVPRTSASGAGDDLAPVAACFARVARRWRFPSPTSAGVVLVRYSFALTPPR
ncbi:MAG: AgmX/PglI C-terminal domain-containing protein [Polyangiales bacterium]